MITELVRAADPAADLRPSATSETADAMLREVLRHPRGEPAAPRLPWRRVVIGTAAAAAAAAVAFAVAGPAENGNHARPVGYTIHHEADGMVQVEIDQDRFADPAALQRSLHEQGVRAVVLAGRGRTIVVGRAADGRLRLLHADAVEPCARYMRMDGRAAPERDPNGPVEFKDAATWDESGLYLRPGLLPADGTFVIDIFRSHGIVHGFSADVAIGRTPTCVG